MDVNINSLRDELNKWIIAEETINEIELRESLDNNIIIDQNVNGIIQLSDKTIDKQEITPNSFSKFWIRLNQFETQLTYETCQRDIGHEIANPLTAIGMNLDYLKSLEFDEEIESVVTSIRNSTDQLKSSLNAIKKQYSYDDNKLQYDKKFYNSLIYSLYPKSILINQDIWEIENFQLIICIILLLQRLITHKSGESVIFVNMINDEIEIKVNNEDIANLIGNSDLTKFITYGEYNGLRVLLQGYNKKSESFGFTFSYQVNHPLTKFTFTNNTA